MYPELFFMTVQIKPITFYKNRLNYVLAVHIIVVNVCVSFSQTELGYHQLWNNYSLINPAATGLFGKNYLSISRRSENTYINKNPKAFSFILDHRFLKRDCGVGISFKNDKWDTNLGLYGQSGKRVVANTSNNLSAYYAGLNVGYAINTKFKTTLGYEFLSGKNQDDTSTDFKSFTPIFGTNHAFNGFMDYFYVGNHQNSVGLQDIFLKLNYTQNKWQFNLIPHLFSAPNTVLDASLNKMDSNLGTEIDFTTSCNLQKDVVATAGYSQMFGSKTLEVLKGGNKEYTTNWVWIMVSINPRIFTSK